MSKPLSYISFKAPGFFGLNSQDSGVALSNNFALQATNCVIDSFGRIGARKGWTPRSATNATLGTAPIKTIVELQLDSGLDYISAGGNKLFQGLSTLSEMTIYNVAGTDPTPYTITNDLWQAAVQPSGIGLNATISAIFVQANHRPLFYHKLPGSTVYGFQLVGDNSLLPAGYTTATFLPNVALAAYGRIWFADIPNDRQTVYFSDTNDPHNIKTGTAGYLNIANIVPENQHITGLAANNGFLLIFTQKYIVIYANPNIPANLTLQDTINGTGCISRDSITNTGNDVLFLSDRGVQSLQRIVQEKSMPMRDISKNVRDDLISYVSQETVTNIKATYYEKDAFYLLNLPTSKVTYCFDMRSPLEDGSARATIWDSITPAAFCATSTRKLYIGKPGYIAEYTGYSDNTEQYRMSYFTNYVDMDKPGQDKILKKIALVLIGASSQPIVAKWGFDYSTSFQAATRSLGNTVPAEYGIAQYNIDTYSVGVDIGNFTYQASGTGKVVQLGFETDINGAPLSIQKLDLFVKEGKIR